MSPTTLLLCLLNLAAIGALPRVFFRPGRFNASWWLTASPFLFTGAVMLLAMGPLEPSAIGGVPAALAATFLSAASLALIAFTLGTHRQPVSLWHQDDDAPDGLVTWGAYARIRHPFYSAFLLALLGCLAAFPHPLTALGFGVAAVQLNRTARREEVRLLASSFGEAYATYMERTGRFVPRAYRSPRSNARNRSLSSERESTPSFLKMLER
jgi:protein-S-isoprenylcysteine O-methyltransferase Ste14